MKKTSPSATRRQTILRHGHTVSLTNYEQTGEDDYGENYAETTNSPYDITARVTWTTSQAQENRTNRTAGEEDADRLFIIRDDAEGVSELTDGGGEGASELTDSGNTYYLLNTQTNDDGTLTLETVQE